MHYILHDLSVVIILYIGQRIRSKTILDYLHIVKVYIYIHVGQ